MNAGRLHEVLELIKRDYEKHNTVARLQTVAQALADSITSVNENTAIAFRSALDDLYSALDQSLLACATPSQLEILSEIGAVDKVGAGLRSEIGNSLDSNNVTPANALAELQRIAEVISAFSDVVSQIVGGFEQLKILMTPWMLAGRKSVLRSLGKLFIQTWKDYRRHFNSTTEV